MARPHVVGRHSCELNASKQCPSSSLGWTDAEIKRPITEGIDKDGNRLKGSIGFVDCSHMTDAGRDAIVAYLRTVPLKDWNQIRSRTMNFRNAVRLPALAGLGFALAAMLVISPSAAHAVTNEQLVGTWRLVSITFTNAQGAVTEPFGPHPLGSVTFDAKGHYTQVIVPGENGAAKGIVANFADYFVTNGGKTLVVHLVGSNNPRADGKDVPRAITLSHGELKENNTNTAVGSGHAEVVFKRVK